jgi:hypothetical protein
MTKKLSSPIARWKNRVEIESKKRSLEEIIGNGKKSYKKNNCKKSDC